jgi:uncharacterized membrane protein YgcG
VTVVVVNNTATVWQTNSFLTRSMMFRQNAFMTTRMLTRGDLVLVAGTRTANVLRAQLILFAGLTSSDFSGMSSSSGYSSTGSSSSGNGGSHW